MKVAVRLRDMGVDVIEAGFPASCQPEFDATKKINETIGEEVEVTALSRMVKDDIDRTLDTGVKSIHLFIATSDIHLKYKLKITREQVEDRVYTMIRYAKDRGVTVEFSPEDATRTDRDFLLHVVRTAISAGADRINIPDTVGVMDPFRMRDLIADVVSVAKGRTVSVHCHNDFGLATANSIAGVMGGASQVHVTINGMGERAGNASLEEVVMALKKLGGFEVNVRTSMLYETSRMLSEMTGMMVPFFKPVVGDNAFGHEAGIHVHGVLENPETYEPMTPEEVGNFRRIAIGKHSGIHGLRMVLREGGVELPDDKLRIVLEKIKEMAGDGRRITPNDAIEIARQLGNA